MTERVGKAPSHGIKRRAKDRNERASPTGQWSSEETRAFYKQNATLTSQSRGGVLEVQKKLF